MVEREAEALECGGGYGLIIFGGVAEEEREQGGGGGRREVGRGGGVVGARALQVEEARVRGGAVGLRRNLRHLPRHRRRRHGAEEARKGRTFGEFGVAGDAYAGNG